LKSHVYYFLVNKGSISSEKVPNLRI